MEPDRDKFTVYYGDESMGLEEIAETYLENYKADGQHPLYMLWGPPGKEVEDMNRFAVLSEVPFTWEDYESWREECDID
jgi:hypothetical protein